MHSVINPYRVMLCSETGQRSELIIINYDCDKRLNENMMLIIVLRLNITVESIFDPSDVLHVMLRRLCCFKIFSSFREQKLH